MAASEPRPSGSTPPRSLPAHETLHIYRPEDIALDVTKVFPEEFENWKRTASDQGYLRLRPTCMLGIVGLYGSLAIGDPPSPEDVEAWEASKPKDHWDYHSLFDFISVPAAGREGGLDVVIFHSQDSFQERPLEIAHRLHLPKAESELFVQERCHYTEFNGLNEQQLLTWHWNRLRNALELRYGAADLRKQTWTVENKVYDITFPDDCWSQ
jgi:hypothetical protein